MADNVDVVGAEVPKQKSSDMLMGGIRLRSVLLLAALCIAPAIMHFMGIDFGSRGVPFNPSEDLTQLTSAELADRMFFAVAGGLHHGLLEWSSVVIAIVTVLLSFVHYQVNRDLTVPIIGMAFLCSGLIDAFHTLAALRLIDAVAENTDLIPFTWALSRSFHVVILLVGIAIALAVTKRSEQSRQREGTKGLYIVSAVSIGFVILSYVVVHMAATSVDLPQTQFPDAVITRPYDAIPLVMFIIALPLFWRLHTRVKSVFSTCLVLVLIPEVVLESHMAFGSSALFDSHFNIAHFLKILAYFVPFSGLLLDYIQTYNKLHVKVEQHKQAEIALVAERNKAEQATQMKSDFLANMSHEIRTPMNGVIGTTGLLLDTKLSNKQRHYARTTMRSAEALLELINDILDFSKIEAGKLDLEKVPFDMQRLVTEVSEVLAIKCREKDIEFLLHFPRETVQHVIGDPGRVRQILLNLLSNAVKFTEEGHVLLTVKSTMLDSGRVEYQVTVEDTGIGIPSEKVATVFNKFDQADTSTTRQYGGTGLGLSICQNLTELMGGQISVESELGKGSVFKFRILVEADASNDAAKQAMSVSPDVEVLRSLKVLTVDDSAVANEVVSEQLRGIVSSLETTECPEDGLEMLAVAAASGAPFDMVVTDFCMPRMDGKMFAEKIKSDPVLKDTVLVLVTSAPKKGDGSAMTKMGFSGYLTKPVFPGELPEVLSAAYQASRDTKNGALVTRHSIKDGVEKKREQLNLQNTHILLVEDNPVNLMVAESILSKFGCFVTPAGNGQEALELVMQREFDLVFMDCQMPVMDGFEASRRIRAHEKKYEQKHTPIVAFTANAMEGDRERCLDAGMDDYMSKPVKQEVIEAILLKWLSEKTGKEAEVAADVIEYDTLETLSQLTDGQHIAIVESYIEFAQDAVPEIVKAAEAGDANMVREQAHALKASSKQLGAMQLGDLAGELEMRGMSGDLGDVELIVRQVKEMGELVLKAFNEYVSDNKRD